MRNNGHGVPSRFSNRAKVLSDLAGRVIGGLDDRTAGFRQKGLPRRIFFSIIPIGPCGPVGLREHTPFQAGDSLSPVRFRPGFQCNSRVAGKGFVARMRQDVWKTAGGRFAKNYNSTHSSDRWRASGNETR